MRFLTLSAWGLRLNREASCRKSLVYVVRQRHQHAVLTSHVSPLQAGAHHSATVELSKPKLQVCTAENSVIWPTQSMCSSCQKSEFFCPIGKNKQPLTAKCSITESTQRCDTVRTLSLAAYIGLGDFVSSNFPVYPLCTCETVKIMLRLSFPAVCIYKCNEVNGLYIISLFPYI